MEPIFFADLPIKLNVTMENNALIIIQGEKNCKKIFSALEGAWGIADDSFVEWKENRMFPKEVQKMDHNTA